MKPIPVVTQAWISRDLTMPERNWDALAKPLTQRPPVVAIDRRRRV